MTCKLSFLVTAFLKGILASAFVLSFAVAVLSANVAVESSFGKSQRIKRKRESHRQRPATTVLFTIAAKALSTETRSDRSGELG